MLTRHARRGFTLIELLLILAILAVLAALIHPVLINAREKARQTHCANNVRQQLLAIQVYQQHHNQLFPEAGTVWNAVAFPPKSLLCPTYGIHKGNGYGYYQWLSGRTPGDPMFPPANRLPVVGDSARTTHLLASSIDLDGRHSGKATVGWADGHVSLALPGTVIFPVTELIGEQVTTWPTNSYSVFSRLHPGGYYQQYMFEPPFSWESPAYTDTANYFGYYMGTTVSRDYSIGLYGTANYDTPYTGNPGEMYFRMPINSFAPGAPAPGTNGKWALNLPYADHRYMGQSLDLRKGIDPPEIRGYVTISVLDDAANPIASLQMRCSGTDVQWKLNGTTFATAANQATTTTEWHQEQSYIYASGDRRHSYMLACDTNGTTTGVVSVPDIGVGATATGGTLGGNISRPTWLEFRVSCFQTGQPGLGGIRVFTPKYGGGIIWSPLM